MSSFGKLMPERSCREKRRSLRHKANAPAIVQTTASQLSVIISDISETGARVVSFGPPPARQYVRLYVNGIWLFGRIAWRREKAFGIQFEEGLCDYSPAELQKAVAEASANSSRFDREAILSELMNKAPSSDERATT